ncbi:MAG: hypothetical protein ACLFU2_01880 [Opitutales bacterium]
MILSASSRRILRLRRLARWGLLAPVLVFGSLEDRSPFLPPGYGTPQAPPPSAVPAATMAVGNLRFKGVFAVNGELRFNIFDQGTGRGQWVRLAEVVDGAYHVAAYDEATRTVQLSLNGTVSRLEMAKPSDAPVAVASLNPPVPPSPPRIQPSNTPSRPEANRPVVRRRTVVPPRPRVTQTEGGARTIVTSRRINARDASAQPDGDAETSERPEAPPNPLLRPESNP